MCVCVCIQLVYQYTQTKVKRFLTLPYDGDGEDFPYIPNKCFPSDHLALGIEYVFAGDTSVLSNMSNTSFV